MLSFSVALLVLHALCLSTSVAADGLTWNFPALSFVNFGVGSCDIPGSFMLGRYNFNKWSRYTDANDQCTSTFHLVYSPRNGKNLQPANIQLHTFDATGPSCDASCQVDWEYQKTFFDYHDGVLSNAKLLCNNGEILAVLGENDVWNWGSFADSNRRPNQSMKKYMLVYSTGTDSTDINDRSMWPTISAALDKEDRPDYCVGLFPLMTKLQSDCLIPMPWSISCHVQVAPVQARIAPILPVAVAAKMMTRRSVPIIIFCLQLL